MPLKHTRLSQIKISENQFNLCHQCSYYIEVIRIFLYEYYETVS